MALFVLPVLHFFGLFALLNFLLPTKYLRAGEMKENRRVKKRKSKEKSDFALLFCFILFVLLDLCVNFLLPLLCTNCVFVVTVSHTSKPPPHTHTHSHAHAGALAVHWNANITHTQRMTISPEGKWKTAGREFRSLQI